MSRTLQFKRFANTAVANTTGLSGEIIIDNTNNTITVHDGVTLGGTRIATEKFASNAGVISVATPTIVSNTTISPTTSIVFVSGTNAIANIIPSSTFTMGGQLTVIPTGAFTTTTAGNIALASTAVPNKTLLLTYSGTTGKWYPSY